MNLASGDKIRGLDIRAGPSVTGINITRYEERERTLLSFVDRLLVG